MVWGRSNNILLGSLYWGAARDAQDYSLYPTKIVYLKHLKFFMQRMHL